MIKKRFYTPSEYSELLEFCIRTTNIGPKAESILRSIYRKFVAHNNISVRQYEALHNISVMCADSHFAQSILRSLKFEEPIFKMPLFVLEDDDLRFPYPSGQLNKSVVPVEVSDELSVPPDLPVDGDYGSLPILNLDEFSVSGDPKAEPDDLRPPDSM